ncbi:MAG: hypothetical protein BYD32DRAFT_235941 [Podila humilis]|nr:MAG: hypothetical protein BYD32DRAFT_235941 [Podila humilis]
MSRRIFLKNHKSLFGTFFATQNAALSCESHDSYMLSGTFPIWAKGKLFTRSKDKKCGGMPKRQQQIHDRTGCCRQEELVVCVGGASGQISTVGWGTPNGEPCARTSTIFATPAVQARQLTIHAGASVAVGAQRISSPYRSQVRSYADYVVKVPHMADSISEGSLKQWNKKVGDFVALDEEIATIETDKVPPRRRSPRRKLPRRRSLRRRSRRRSLRRRPPRRPHQNPLPLPLLSPPPSPPLPPPPSAVRSAASR